MGPSMNMQVAIWRKKLWALVTRKRFLDMGPSMNMHVAI